MIARIKPERNARPFRIKEADAGRLPLLLREKAALRPKAWG